MFRSSATAGERRSVDAILTRLAARGRALVALSGGVDSAVVAALAHEALGSESLAVTVAGPSVSAREVESARSVARTLGLAHEVVAVDPLARAEYRANPVDRCYYCRTVETAALLRLGRARRVAQYLDGVHADDLGEVRFGLAAMDAAGFDHPLAWAGWTKEEVRREARTRGLPNRERPSEACLASRVAHGEPISAELLGRVERAEAFLHARGFARVRVRTRSGGARVEVDPEEVARLLEEPLCTELAQALGSLGFDPVTVDPNGYGRSGPVRGPSR